LERREADKRHAEIVNAPLVDERRKRTNSSMNVPVGKKASWETLIIPKNLHENLQAYCRILQDFQAYKMLGCICRRDCFSTVRPEPERLRSQKPLVLKLDLTSLRYQPAIAKSALSGMRQPR